MTFCRLSQYHCGVKGNPLIYMINLDFWNLFNQSCETLNDLIKRAGGLSERAFSKGAFFSRRNLRVKEEEQKERLISQLEADLATATLSATDSADAAKAQSAANAMLSRLRNTESQGRLVIDLDKILHSKNNSSLLVKSGDQLFASNSLLCKCFR